MCNKTVQHVAAPASASASVFLLDPDQEVILRGTCTQQEWDYLLAERISIMEDSLILSSRAFALALADTRSNHGPRPGGEA